MTYATEAVESSVAPQCSDRVPDAEEAGVDEIPFAAMVLDWLGSIRYCHADAARLFGESAQALVGWHVKELIPDLPFSPSTPWYNIAYATFWAHQGPQRGFCGLDNQGRAFGLEVALDRLDLDECHRIIVTLAATGYACLIAGTGVPLFRDAVGL